MIIAVSKCLVSIQLKWNNYLTPIKDHGICFKWGRNIVRARDVEVLLQTVFSEYERTTMFMNLPQLCGCLHKVYKINPVHIPM